MIRACKNCVWKKIVHPAPEVVKMFKNPILIWCLWDPTPVNKEPDDFCHNFESKDEQKDAETNLAIYKKAIRGKVFNGMTDDDFVYVVDILQEKGYLK